MAEHDIKEFIPLLRQHIDKENNILYQMAQNVLSEADDADLTDKFSKVEQEQGSCWTARTL